MQKVLKSIFILGFFVICFWSLTFLDTFSFGGTSIEVGKQNSWLPEKQIISDLPQYSASVNINSPKEIDIESGDQPSFALANNPKVPTNVDEVVTTNPTQKTTPEVTPPIVATPPPQPKELDQVISVSDDIIKPSSHQGLPSTITIDAIGISNIPFGYGSIASEEEKLKVDKNLLSSPIIENQLSSEPCINGKNSYIMGHSSPPNWLKVPDSGNSKYPGVRVFEKIGKNQLPIESIIHITNRSGITCKYKVTSNWIEKTQGSENGFTITDAQFNSLFNPVSANGVLTIQTCAIQTSGDTQIIDPINDMRMIRAELLTN